jgi:hypothetical protein
LWGSFERENMLRTTTIAWAGLVVLAIASSARADSGVAGRFHWTGDVEGRFDDGNLTVSPVASGAFSVDAVEKRKTGDLTWIGSATLVNATLTIERPEGTVGFTGALSGARAATTLEYVAVFDADLDRAVVTVYRKDAQGHATEIGRGSLEDHVPFWEHQPGDLLALEEKYVDRAIHKEIDLQKSFSVADYTSLGLKASAQLLSGSNVSDFMKEGDRAFRLAGKGEPVWVRTTVEGGPTVSWGHSIPLGQSASLSVGFSAGATLRYVCDEELARPVSVGDVDVAKKLVLDLPAKAFVLPATVDKALSLPEGSRRSLEGEGSLALSGGAAFGQRLDDLGVLTDRAQIGIDAGFSVNWGLHGDLKLEFERQSGDLVHLRWTQGGQMTAGAAVNFLLGLYVAPALEDKAPKIAQGPVTAVVQRGEAYTCVQFDLSKEWLDAQETVIDLTFDLSQGPARAAFEDAVLGDLRAVQALVEASQRPNGSAGGLVAYRVQSTATDQLTYSLHFGAFQVVSYDRVTQTTDVHISVETLDGTRSATDIFSYAKRARGFFARLFGDGERSLDARATNRTVVTADGKESTGEQVSFTFDQTLRSPSHERIDEELLMASTLFGETAIAGEVEKVHAADVRDPRKTEVKLEVTFGPKAVARILSQGAQAFYAAYGAAHVPGEEAHDWTPERVESLRHVSLIHENNATRAEEALRLEAWDLDDASQVEKLLEKAKKASANPVLQMKQFRDIAKEDGFKLRGLVALVELAGTNDARVALTLKGKGLDFEHAQGQASALPASP